MPKLPFSKPWQALNVPVVYGVHCLIDHVGMTAHRNELMCKKT